MIENIQIKS